MSPRPAFRLTAALAAVASTLILAALAATDPASRPMAPAMGEYPLPVNEAEVAEGADPALAARLALRPETRARPKSRFATETERLLDEERQSLAALTLRLRASRPGRDRLAVEREIERVKVETELALLRLQLGEARRLGRTETARVLEEAIEGFLRPRPPLAATPPARPAPSTAAER